MQQDIDSKHLSDVFLGPAVSLLKQAKHTRSCPGLSDRLWLEMGVNRILADVRSGRDFLQEWAMANGHEDAVGVSLFFETLKSSRRCHLITELNTQLAQSMETHPDLEVDWKLLGELKKMEVWCLPGMAITTRPVFMMLRLKVNAGLWGIFIRLTYARMH